MTNVPYIVKRKTYLFLENYNFWIVKKLPNFLKLIPAIIQETMKVNNQNLSGRSNFKEYHISRGNEGGKGEPQIFCMITRIESLIVIGLYDEFILVLKSSDIDFLSILLIFPILIYLCV